MRASQARSGHDEIVAAARAAHAHESIVDLPGGYDGTVGERGITLSGGQRQRIAIARPLLKNAPILILDEPTSAVDAESERLIMEGIQQLIQARTVILITHRPSLIQLADRVVALRDGGIVPPVRAASGTAQFAHKREA